MKRIAVCLLIVCILISMSPTTALAVGETYEGTCGDNLTWKLSDRTLTISGTGPMYDYPDVDTAPWAEYSGYISKIIIEEGVTTIGNHAFHMLRNISQEIVVRIASTVTYLGDRAFFLQLNKDHYVIYFLGAAPEVGERPIVFSYGAETYVVNWSEEEKARFQVSNSNFTDATILFDPVKSNQLIGLNETLTPDDLFFYFLKTAIRYSPRDLYITPYDNTTYGEKNVTITADGFSFDFTFFITDGSNHLDLISAEFPKIYEYSGSKIYSAPTLKMGSMELNSKDHYTVSTTANLIGNDNRVTITGKGIAEGFEQTFYYPILKKDISKTVLNLNEYLSFQGAPLKAWGLIRLEENENYGIFYEKNINVGEALGRVIGLGDYYYGEMSGTYVIRIADYPESINLNAEYIGMVDGELSEEIPI